MKYHAILPACFASLLVMAVPGASYAAASAYQPGVAQTVPQKLIPAQFIEGGPGSGTGTGRYARPDYGPGSGTGTGRCRTVLVKVCRPGGGDGMGPRCRMVRQTRC